LTYIFSQNSKAISRFESIAENIKYINPTGNEHCEAPHFYSVPRGIVEGEGRLQPTLRQASKLADPIHSLQLAAISDLRGQPIFSNAYADLAVTGRRAMTNFRVLHYSGKISEQMVFERLSKEHDLSQYNHEKIWAAISKAIDRAYKVSNVILFGNSIERQRLGWLAVSGEDDQPYRPINVSATEFTQFDLNVYVACFVDDLGAVVADDS